MFGLGWGAVRLTFYSIARWMADSSSPEVIEERTR
jgi:hypothetical protein